jgi:hypothetical protein
MYPLNCSSLSKSKCIKRDGDLIYTQGVQREENWAPLSKTHCFNYSLGIALRTAMEKSQIKHIGHMHVFSRCYCGCSEMLVLLAPTVQEYLTETKIQ